MKTFQIANTILKNRYVQAPLAGYSDFAMRTMAFEAGASLCYTEMISANALAYDSVDTINMVEETKKDIGPVALQLFGYEIDHMQIAIDKVEALGKYDFLDINLGCPVPKVMRQNSGSHLLTDLDYLYRFMRAVVVRSKHPVIAKTRLGFSSPNIEAIVKTLESAGVSAIAIHGRTRSEFYLGKPHYDLIAKAKAMANVPIIANGNIGPENSLEVFDLTHADAEMIGRNAIGNPLVFSQLIQRENGEPITPLDFDTQWNLCRKHIELEFEKKRAVHVIALELRAIAPMYFSHVSGTKGLRSSLVRCQSKEEYLEVMDAAKAQRSQGISDNA